MRATDLLRRLRRLSRQRGWEFHERSGKGSHLVVSINGRKTVLPMHPGDMPEGTYRGILKALGLRPTDVEG